MELKFHTKPWAHQIAAIKYLMDKNCGALFLDMGSGKTKIIVDLIVNKGFKRVLILAPKKVCRVWEPQIAMHAPNEKIQVINVSNIPGSSKSGAILKNLTEANFDGIEVVINNYDSVWREPFKQFVLKRKWDAVICDESHRIKTPGSKISKFMAQLGKTVPNRFIATGTPLAQSPLDIYGQYKFLDPKVFGTSYNDFKQRYANWVLAVGGFLMLDKKNPYKNLDELTEKMLSRAFTAKVDLDLPEIQEIIVPYDMSKIAQKHYKELQKEGCLMLESGAVDPGNVLALITRLQQLTSGYLPTEGGVEEIDKSRQEVLYEILEGIDEPVVVFAKFKKDIKNIISVAESLGKHVAEVSGRVDEFDSWKDVLVVQIAAGAEGIDFTKARYAIYYTLSHALWQYKQSKKRLHRPGQRRNVKFYYLMAQIPGTKTIDERIYKALMDNENLIESLLEV